MTANYPYYNVKDFEQGKVRIGENTPPDWVRDPQVTILYAGYFWGVVFMLLQGFVMPLNFFKTGKTQCITGSSCRRYFRLMIPVFFTLSTTWFFLRMDAYGDSTFEYLN